MEATVDVDAFQEHSRKGQFWTPQEDEILKNLVEQTKDWLYIASKIPGRTPFTCKRHYNDLNLQLRSVIKPWTPNEDGVLREIMQSESGTFQMVYSRLPGRNRNSVRRRWCRIKDKEPDSSVPWTQQEDENLRSLAESFGRSYHTISNQMPGRTARCCRDRYELLYLKYDFPLARRESWTKENDEVLRELIEKHGKDFKLMSKLIPGRTEDSIRSRHLRISKSSTERMASIDVKKWTKEEEQRLLQIVEAAKKDWMAISIYFPHRSIPSLYRRYLELIKSENQTQQ